MIPLVASVVQRSSRCFQIMPTATAKIVAYSVTRDGAIQVAYDRLNQSHLLLSP